MKNIFLFITIAFLFAGCCKLKKLDCHKYDGIHKFIYEPIVISEDCNCIVAGKVKYLENCETVALIHYGDGSCDNIATKIICENGECYNEDGAPIAAIDFIVDCNGNTITEGPVNSNELNQLFDPNLGPQP